ncbi:class I SAM-dependent methyltransferase [uncultured Kordia sp.]|uniref:class I SAM-dependent methyltransferase n=1 Tax=uncultured Kordia sp. TaxID=507699 RepID=UPI00261AE8EB|nr:class I SAM-dependent methyltransferase [uncultured Kordia sp.]
MNDENASKKRKKPWPTKAAMEQVYELHLWGKGNADFYSGEGSHDPELVNPYVEVVRSFLTSVEKPLIVCDLGCGDFNVGKELITYASTYIAVDIVPDLIVRNTKKFSAESVTFHCLDIAVDALPIADCALVRQVLQHLSNAEVEKVVRKLEKYPYVILTEHLPNGSFIPNKDIISGQGIRLKKQSGIDLLAAPFHFKVKEEKQLLSIVPKNGKGVIVTTLYTVF